MGVILEDKNKRYLLIEQVNAQPMLRGDYAIIRQVDIREEDSPKDEGFMLEEDTGQIRWMSKELFNNTYKLKADATEEWILTHTS